MKNRFLLLIMIGLLSLSLVSVTLVAAGVAQVKGQTPDSSAPEIPPQANNPNPSYVHQIANPSNPNSRSLMAQPAGGQPKTNLSLTMPDNPGERMRQQVMSVQPSGVEEVNRFEFWMNSSGWTQMWGEVTPVVTVTVWLPRDPYSMTSVADPSCPGCFGFSSHASLYPGDVVSVTTSAGDPPVTIQVPDPLEAHADSLAGYQVWGQIGGWDTREVELHNAGGLLITTTTTDGEGNFATTWLGMQRGNPGYIRFVDQVDSTSVIFHRPFADLEPQIRVNYAHEWIEGDYEAGHTLWITLTNATGDVKATASGTTGSLDMWGGWEGWSTNVNVPWIGGQPDIQPGDYVSVKVANGRSGEVHIAGITGNLDVSADTISGNLIGDWLTGTVNGGCNIWTNNGPPGTGFSAEPPDYAYFCDFGSVFDILPGMDAAVDYREPDNDQVINVFHQPAPHLLINLWGEGTPASGGNYVLRVSYNNDGEATAPNVVITHTLWGMTYLTDTSGLLHTGTGDPLSPLIWQVGDLEPSWSGSHEFYVFVQVVNPPGAGLFADTHIATDLPYFQGNENEKYSSWGYDPIPEINVDVNIGKWAWTGDPVPGGEFVYDVNVCNNGSTSSAWVVMTDTLPLSTTLVYWWGGNPGWQEVSHSDHQLVVTRPTIQEGGCSEVLLLVHLDETAWLGMQLHNVADVTTSNDGDPNNNHAENGISVGQPHPNLALGSNWVQGRHVPGGDISYGFYYVNTGNVPLDDILVTSTLPAGTIFANAYIWTLQGEQLYPPDTVISPTLTQDGYAVWNVGHMANGQRMDVRLSLWIDEATQPGVPLDIQIDISPQPWEDRYDDNTLRYQEQVNDFGPNLRVDKHTNWQWEQWGEDDYLINHELRILNLGTQQLEDVWITDTLPDQANLESWWQNHGPKGMDVHPGDGNIAFYIPQLQPGETASIGYRIRFEPGTVKQGMAFTDYMEAPIEGDVNPADNYDSVTAYSGPDVFVRKYLSGGIPEPGEIITFTVEFGNQNRWWNGDDKYSSLVIDSLPEGMTFITATAPGTPGEHWTPWLIVDNTLIWVWGPMWAQTSWWYELVVQLDADLEPGQVLVNQIDAYGESPNDIDPDLTNNHAEYAVTLPLASVSLAPPSQTASATPGSTVTYSFILTNTGNMADTFAISATGVWTTQLSATSSGELLPGDSFTFTLQVTVPTGAQEGQQDTAQVTVQSGNETTVQASANVTTTAAYIKLWLPIIKKP
jgi:uncharacterized repeat protein (TIGR01451 family)